MTEPNLTQNTSEADTSEANTSGTNTSGTNTSSEVKKPLKPINCFLGAIVAGAIAYLLYNMTSSIAIAFASRVVQSDNMIIVRMSAAVRTLVIGMAAMGTGIFGMAAIGLTGLGIQILLGKSPETPN